MEKIAKNSLWQSLSDFQAECPAIAKSTSGYGYKYADLPTIHSVIDPILRKHGLVVSQPLVDGCVETRLVHIQTGEHLVSSIPVPSDVLLKGMNKFQTDGSAITYYRRYALSSILGIVTEDDNDAAGKQVKSPAKPKVRVVNPNTQLFNNCCKGYRDGVSRDEMVDKGLSITDEVWSLIEECSRS